MATKKENISVCGRIGSDFTIPTSQGAPKLKFSVVETDYERDEQGNFVIDPDTGHWVVKTAVWYQFATWNERLAETIQQTLRKGDSIVAVGDLSFSNYTDKHGSERTSMQLEPHTIGPDIRSGRVTLDRTPTHQAVAPTQSVSATPTVDVSAEVHDWPTAQVAR